ncbi:MAG: hypothetical protein AB1611_04785 [bacterium]
MAQEPFNQQDAGLRPQSEETIRKAFDLAGQIHYSHFLSGKNEDAGISLLEHHYPEDRSDPTDQIQMWIWGSRELGKSHLSWKIKSFAQTNSSETEKKSEVEEACITWPLHSELRLSAGQKVFSWGKARAWNPQAFIDSPHDPLDSDPSHDGLVFGGFEYGQKYPPGPDPLQELTFTTLIFPVQERVNEEFGQPKNWNLAGKLSLLFWNTEIDFVTLKGKSRPERYGFSFSRQLRPRWEFYGDFGMIPNNEKIFLDQSGDLWEISFPAIYSLWGLQYEGGTVRWTGEYYRNKAGFTPEEMRSYYQYLHRITDSQTKGGNNEALARRLMTLTRKYYHRPDLMQVYAYTEILKRGFLWIKHLTSSLAGVWNLQDQSYCLCPQFRYDSPLNLSVGLQGTFAGGKPFTEFGEKAIRWSVEASLTYSFDLLIYYRSSPNSPGRYLRERDRYPREAGQSLRKPDHYPDEPGASSNAPADHNPREHDYGSPGPLEPDQNSAGSLR